MKNANLPHIECQIFNTFLDGSSGTTKAFLVSVRGIYGQALQFTALLETGALFTGLPAHSITFGAKTPNTLKECQMYDNIGTDIEVITLNLLEGMKATLKTNSGAIIPVKYLFSIDFVNGGYSKHPEQWKMFHVVKSDAGHVYIYPQYRLQFKDAAICPLSDKPMPKYKANKIKWEVEQ